MKNLVILEGYAYRAMSFGPGKSILRFKLENDTPAPDGSDRTKKNWIDCVLFNPTPAHITALAANNVRVRLEGTVQSSQYGEKESRKYRQDVVVNPAKLVITPKSPRSAATPQDEDEIALEDEAEQPGHSVNPLSEEANA